MGPRLGQGELELPRVAELGSNGGRRSQVWVDEECGVVDFHRQLNGRKLFCEGKFEVETFARIGSKQAMPSGDEERRHFVHGTVISLKLH